MGDRGPASVQRGRPDHPRTSVANPAWPVVASRDRWGGAGHPARVRVRDPTPRRRAPVALRDRGVRMTICQYKDCGDLATLNVIVLGLGETIWLCDGCIADWGVHWRDDHSTLVEEL